MRVAFKNMINGYSGKADGSVIYYIRKTNSFYIKKRPHMPQGENQNRFQAIMLNLGTIKPDFYYKEDFGFYLELYNQLTDKKYSPVIAWNDLSTITKQQMYDQNLPCLSVKKAVEAGLLPIVKGYTRFSNPI
jgi:hypothetical protein